jgi:hypothetical protein
MALSINLRGISNTLWSFYDLRGEAGDYAKAVNWLIRKGMLPREPEFRHGVWTSDLACVDISWLPDDVLVVAVAYDADAEAFEFYCTGYTGVSQ